MENRPNICYKIDAYDAISECLVVLVFMELLSVTSKAEKTKCMNQY